MSFSVTDTPSTPMKSSVMQDENRQRVVEGDTVSEPTCLAVKCVQLSFAHAGVWHLLPQTP